MDALHAAERDARRVEPCRAGEQRAVMGVIEPALFERRAVNADAERLAEDERIARPRADVALQMLRIDGSNRDQAVDRLERIDRVPACNRNAGLGADRFAKPAHSTGHQRNALFVFCHDVLLLPFSQTDSSKSSRPISMRRISLVPAPMS